MKSYALAMKVAHKMPLLQVILDKLSGISSELCMWPHTHTHKWYGEFEKCTEYQKQPKIYNTLEYFMSILSLVIITVKVALVNKKLTKDLPQLSETVIYFSLVFNKVC